MTPLNIQDVIDYVEENIGDFHQRRIARIKDLKLITVLTKKNPYLFRAKNIVTGEEIVRGITDAFISSNEETIFGDWLEKMAIFINGKVYGGRKSSAKGIDLEFDFGGKRYIVAIKSGPNWGNSSQIKKMKTDFISAKKTLRSSNSQLDIVAVNGCCYGKKKRSDDGQYYLYCGQEFWEFISGNAQLYTELIEPLGHKAREKNEEFQEEYCGMINLFTKDFNNNYLTSGGKINWIKLVQLNSAKSSGGNKTP